MNVAVKVRKRTLNDGDVKGTWLQNRGTQRGLYDFKEGRERDIRPKKGTQGGHIAIFSAITVLLGSA